MTNRIGFQPVQILGALLAGSLIEFSIMLFTLYFPSLGGGYGAPFEVGQTSGFVLIASKPTTFSWVIFGLDVAAGTALFLLFARWSGLLGILLGAIGAFIALAVVILMAAYNLPVAGLPIPLFRTNPLPSSLVLWVDMFFWAGALAGLVRWRRQRTRAAGL